MSLEKLHEKMSQAIIDFEDEKNLIAGCFIYVYASNNLDEVQIYEFDGEKFSPCKNKKLQELIN